MICFCEVLKTVRHSTFNTGTVMLTLVSPGLTNVEKLTCPFKVIVKEVFGSSLHTSARSNTDLSISIFKQRRALGSCPAVITIFHHVTYIYTDEFKNNLLHLGGKRKKNCCYTGGKKRSKKKSASGPGEEGGCEVFIR